MEIAISDMTLDFPYILNATLGTGHQLRGGGGAIQWENRESETLKTL